MKKEHEDWAEKLKNNPKSKELRGDLIVFDEILSKSTHHSVLTLEQCTSINKDLFRKSKKYTRLEVVNKVEDNFAKGAISKEIRDEAIAVFNKMTKSNYVRREGKRGSYQYIFDNKKEELK
jgi:ribosomal protein L21